MAEACVGSPPQVFVVDSQASYVPIPVGRKHRWASGGQKFLLLMVGLVVFGLVVQGCFIHNLNKKMEAFSSCMCHPLCQNLSSPISSSQQGGTLLSKIRPKDKFNKTSTVRPQTEDVQQRPFAQLMGSSLTVDSDNVVQWINNSEDSITQNMGYKNGRLLVEKDGYYYLYSKVSLDVQEPCLFFQHEVWKDTKAYGKPIRLMKSKRHQCLTHKFKDSQDVLEDYWNSFLAGIFELQRGDEIYIKLDSKQKRHPDPADNLMGAFMISEKRLRPTL
ncbi:tumor necrosis factor ligand superfamily member 14-like [Notolabrus celidotus]|uniref:tumor necrosis factor ligand superfamily member 14-like n=1 Tax=Notolabrus celidotus TaxID=1203425 RepID=UPI001490625F|nr:tumor necrosis factor ligand superfamily member 14-like [Notolabrus celidotus]